MPKNVIHHSDRGVQYLSIRYTNRLEAANLRASVGTTGDPRQYRGQPAPLNL